MKKFFITKKKDKILRVDNISFVYSRKDWEGYDEEIRDLVRVDFFHGEGIEITQEEYKELIKILK